MVAQTTRCTVVLPDGREESADMRFDTRWSYSDIIYRIHTACADTFGVEPIRITITTDLTPS